MSMRKRSGSGSKRHLKEKVVQIYESFFKGEDLTSENPTFWDEFFLLKPKIPQLEAEIHKLSAEQLMNMKDNINLLVFQCIEMLGQEHHIRYCGIRIEQQYAAAEITQNSAKANGLYHNSQKYFYKTVSIYSINIGFDIYQYDKDKR